MATNPVQAIKDEIKARIAEARESTSQALREIADERQELEANRTEIDARLGSLGEREIALTNQLASQVERLSRALRTLEDEAEPEAPEPTPEPVPEPIPEEPVPVEPVPADGPVPTTCAFPGCTYEFDGRLGQFCAYHREGFEEPVPAREPVARKEIPSEHEVAASHAERLGDFTRAELARACGLGRPAATSAIAALARAGLIVQLSERRRPVGHGGRPAIVYRWVPPPAAPVPPERTYQEMTAKEVRERPATARPRSERRNGRDNVVTSGRRLRASHKDLDKYLQVVLDTEGWRAEKRGNNHILVYPPGGGKPIDLPDTPRGQRTPRRVRAELRRAGLDLR